MCGVAHGAREIRSSRRYARKWPDTSPDLRYKWAVQLSDKECYRALKAQDRRFDGRFFICVTSTGIYCRPVCPARTSKFENCRFVKTAAEAEAKGFRACLRCRPETAPGSPACQGTGATVSRALRLISETATEGESLEVLATRLGVGTRHLRRLFNDHLGATPKAIAQTERFAIARQLLTETDMPIVDVALASGFGSTRRFNDATRKAFGVTPTELRRKRRGQSARSKSAGIQVQLGFRPPYAFAEILAYLSTRAIAGVERVALQTYTRTVSIDGACGTLSVRANEERNHLIAEFALDKPVVLGAAVRRVRDMFDLDASPQDVSEHLCSDKLLAPLVKRTPGMRIPGCWEPFELAVRAVVGQQISVKGATTILGRLVAARGPECVGALEDGPRALFPAPADIAGQDLGGLGLTHARTKTLAALSAAFLEQPDFLHPALELGEARERLLAIPGIGPWTADYVALRALRDSDAFPAADLGLLKASKAKSPARLKARAEAWRPWRGYAVYYLWNSLSH